MAPMISGSATFDQILAALRPGLEAGRFTLLEAHAYPEAFGSRHATFTDGRRFLRLVWDGKEQWFVLEGDAEPEFRPASGAPVWIDLALQRFDPTQADSNQAAEVLAHVTAAFAEFAG